MNTENSKTSEAHRFKLDLADKLNLKSPNKNMALAIYYTWKNIKSKYNNNKFKISALLKSKYNKNKFKIPALLISLMVPILLKIFKIILNLLLKNMKLSLKIHQIYPNKIKNRIVFKIKTGFKLELLTPETMKSLGSIKKDVNSDKNVENVPKLESVEVVLVHCNLVKNDYQHTANVLFSFVSNKQFGQLINISPHSLTMMNTVNTEFSFVEVWFTDQTSKVLEIEDNVNLTLIIG